MALFPLLFFAFTVLQRQVGVGVGIFSVAWAVMLSGWLTGQLVRRTTYERPLFVLLATFWHELGAQRRPSSGDAAGASRTDLRVRHGRKEN